MGRRGRTRSKAKAAGFKSGFEQKVAGKLGQKRVEFRYEPDKFKFTQPAKNRTYKPDFHIAATDVYIETKGKLTLADREKLVWVRDQHPGMKLVLLFMKANNPIRKGSKTTYADWADDNDFDWADFDKGIPDRWLKTTNPDGGGLDED